MQALREHYATVRDRCGYDRVDFALGDLPASYLRERFAAVDGRETVAAAPAEPTVFSTGVATTAPPHLGIVGQVLTAVELQRAGVDVQFVLSDLQLYHAGADRETVTGLAERYRSFVRDLGFDPDRGRLRTQAESRDVMHTAQLLARYYRPEDGEYLPDGDPTDWERAVADAYDGADRPLEYSGPTSEAGDRHSAVLHAADFLHPLRKEGYESVVVTLGMDVHELAAGTRRFLEGTPVEGSVAGLHTRLLAGHGGHPKMSKGVPESAIDASMDPETIRRRVLSLDDAPGRPAESAVFRAMAFASTYPPEKVERLRDACAEGGERWERAREAYADHAVELLSHW